MRNNQKCHDGPKKSRLVDEIGERYRVIENRLVKFYNDGE